jgi:hypothetical protein
MDESGNRKTLHLVLSFSVVVLIIAALAYVTGEPEDPCEQTATDTSAAVLADGEDQDGLINRAIILRANCDRAAAEAAAKED